LSDVLENQYLSLTRDEPFEVQTAKSSKVQLESMQGHHTGLHAVV
jgi:hypothetical protein